MPETKSATSPEPYRYGNEFTSVEEFLKAVQERQDQGLQVYGHAVIYIPWEGRDPQRKAARVELNGDINFDVHCENI
jgi:radical SAM superfamily enzyme